MTNDQRDGGAGVGSSRRTFLRATAATGAVLGIGGMTYAQDQEFDTIRLGGVVDGWRGRAPAFIEGETNPALPLQAGQEYTIVWENVDGEPHNVAIFNEAGSVVVRTEIIRGEGQTQRVTFTAEPGMTTYLCQVHPTSMRGDVTIEGGPPAGNETVMPANETMNETAMNETAPTNATTGNVTVPVNESAWGEDPLLYIAEFANGTQPAGNLTDVGMNGTVPAGNDTQVANETANGGGPVATGNETGGNQTERNQTAIEAQHPPANETADNATAGMGNETDDGADAAAGTDNETGGNQTERNQTAIEAQHPPANETADNVTADNVTADNVTVDEMDNETVGMDNETADNETMAVAENETADGAATGPGGETSAVRFTLHPPNGEQPKLLYNIAIWGVEDVTGAEIVLAGQDGGDQVVASLLAPEDPIDYPQGMIAHGTVLAADLLGPLAGESLRALVREIDEGDAYVVVRTRDMGVLRAPIRPVEEQGTDGQDQQTEGSN